MVDPYLRIEGLSKRFTRFTALDSIDLEIGLGEFVCFLGPSGCGKTTLLRIVAGLEQPQSGRVVLDGVDLGGLPPERRGIAMMFQSYALLPHMSVLENVRFPLRMQGTGTAAEQRARARATLDLVKLGDHAGKLPRQLSGGQQQRVALARAIVAEPKLLLLDEPLSNLDARLREDMQIELKELQHRLGITTLLVTHDQEEALSLSDRIVLMREGAVEQVGTADELYRSPATAFAADFIGAANLLPVDVARQDGVWVGRLADGHSVPVPAPPGDRAGPWQLVVRQEDLRVAEAQPVDAAVAGVPAEPVAQVFLGVGARLVFRVAGTQVKALAGREVLHGLPATPWLVWPVAAAHLVPREPRN
ncbi:MAG: ABC transporter ATP-binding protein [Alphaproteobacteria bacterium]